MFSEKLIRDTIKQCIDSGISKFVIYPFGENGMAVKNCMEQCFGIFPVMVVDNVYSQYNVNIFNIDGLRQNYDKDICIILTAQDRTLNQELKERLLSFTTEDRIVNLRDPITQREEEEQKREEEKQKREEEKQKEQQKREEKRKRLENVFSLQSILPQRKEVVHVKSPEGKIKVRFIHYAYTVWNSMRTVCEQFEMDSRFDVLVICHGGADGMIDALEKAKNQMETEQHRYILDSQYSAKDDRPDILIFGGYGMGDGSWCPRGVREYTRMIVSVPMTVRMYHGSMEKEWKSLGGGFREYQPDYCLVDSLLFNKIKDSHIYSDKFVEMGNPKFDGIFNACQQKSYIAGWEKLKGKKTILWATAHEIHGLSGTNTEYITFDLYAKHIFAYADQHPYMGFIFRPHPLLIKELLIYGYWSENDLAEIRQYCDKSPNIVWDETYTYEAGYSVADAVLTETQCGIMVSALPTLKPICVMHRSDEDIVPYNKEGVESCYSARCEKDLTDFFDMVQEGRDPMLEQRREVSKKCVKHFDGRNGERIKNFIVQAYDEATDL